MKKAWSVVLVIVFVAILLGATAIGNLMIFVGPIMLNAWPIWKCWTVFLVVCFVSMSIMLGMVKWLEKVTNC